MSETSTPTLETLLGSLGSLELAPVLAGAAALLLLLALLRPSPRRASPLRLALRLGIAGALALALTGLAWASSPGMAELLVAAPILALLFALGWRVGPWWSGLALFISRRLREGDLVTVGPHQGELRAAGLLRASLVNRQGDLVHVPWSELGAGVVARRGRAPCRARVVLELDAAPEPERLRQLEVRATLCPYRVWDRPAELRRDPEDPRRLIFELWSWSEEGGRRAEDYVRRAVRQDLEADSG